MFGSCVRDGQMRWASRYSAFQDQRQLITRLVGSYWKRIIVDTLTWLSPLQLPALLRLTPL